MLQAQWTFSTASLLSARMSDDSCWFNQQRPLLVLQPRLISFKLSFPASFRRHQLFRFHFHAPSLNPRCARKEKHLFYLIQPLSFGGWPHASDTNNISPHCRRPGGTSTQEISSEFFVFHSSWCWRKGEERSRGVEPKSLKQRLCNSLNLFWLPARLIILFVCAPRTLFTRTLPSPFRIYNHFLSVRVLRFCTIRRLSCRLFA